MTSHDRSIMSAYEVRRREPVVLAGRTKLTTNQYSTMSLDSSIPKVQKAWRVVRQGAPDKALEFHDDVPVVPPSEGEVLVKIKSAALNPV